MSLTLGSLFDGIGGWLLAALHNGVKPVWASEIDEFPAAVTAHHFPEVKQLGDITKIDPDKLEPVDIICAGSPCQDLSVAGKRAGLEGERSGLFHTAIRLVHELRARTGKPRYFVWENVPGAFSSNKGHDFRAVLEEISEAKIPMPKDNKWAESGMVEWDSGSLAWRTLDAQYWGVPQRRKRIFLVADFGGLTAGEILFIEQSLYGDIAKSKGEREGTAADAGAGVESAGGCLTPWDVQSNRVQSAECRCTAAALYGGAGQGTHNGAVWDVRNSAGFKYRNGAKARSIGYADEQAPTLETSQNLAIYDLTHHDEVVRQVHGNKTQTLKARAGTGGNNTPIVQTCYSFDSLASNSMKSSNPNSGCRAVEKSKCLDTTISDPSKNQGGIVVCIAGNTIDRKVENGGNGVGAQEDISYTLNTVDRHAVAVGYRASGFQSYSEDKVAGTLRAEGGTAGGGSETFVTQKTVGCLNADDYKGINNQYVSQGKLVVDDGRNVR